MNSLQRVCRSFVSHQRRNRFVVSSVKAFQTCPASSNAFVAVEEDVEKNMAVMKLRRPPVNSLDLGLIQQISSSIKELENKGCKGFILTSELPSIFSAGLDIKEMVDFDESRMRTFWRSFQELWKTLYLTPLATVAAVNGYAPAAGCMLALSCDIRVMMESKANIGLTGAKFGMAVPQWFRALLQSNMGTRQAEKALSLGTSFSPQEALALNLVDDLASSSDSLQQKALQNINLLMKIPESARQVTKMGMRKKFVEELDTYSSKEVDDTVEFLRQEQVQQMLKTHLENLKFKKSST